MNSARIGGVSAGGQGGIGHGGMTGGGVHCTHAVKSVGVHQLIPSQQQQQHAQQQQLPPPLPPHHHHFAYQIAQAGFIFNLHAHYLSIYICYIGEIRPPATCHT